MARLNDPSDGLSEMAITLSQVVDALFYMDTEFRTNNYIEDEHIDDLYHFIDLFDKYSKALVSMTKYLEKISDKRLYKDY